MSKPAVCVCGDLHMTPNIYSDFYDMRNDAIAAVWQIEAYCLKHKIPLLLAGDVLDASKQRSEMPWALGGLIRKMDVKNLKVFAIQGQHERDNPPWIEVLGGEHISGKGIRKIGGLDVVGIDQSSPTVFQEQLANVPPCDILVIHQMVKESTVGIEGRFDCQLDDLPEQAKLVIAGDNHNAFEAPKNKPPFYYTGSAHMCERGEPLNKRFLVVHDDLSVESVPLLTRPFFDMQVYDETTMTRAIDTLAQQLAQPEDKELMRLCINKPFAYIKYLSDVPDVKARLQVVCGGNEQTGPKVFLKLTPFQSVEKPGEPVKEEGALTLDGCLGEVVKPGEDPDLFEFTQELLRTDNPKGVIDAWKDKFVKGERPMAKV